MTRIFYCGVPLGAEVLRRAGYAPVLAALGPLDLPGVRRMRRLLPKVLELPDMRTPVVRNALQDARPDALLSFFWPRRIPAEVLSAMALGAYGTHPSLLPRWRGPDPYFWTLRQGDPTTGVTLHRLSEAYDEGPVVAHRTLQVHAEDNAWTLAKRLDRPAISLLLHAAQALEAGPLEAKAQSGEPTLAPAPSAEDLRVNWFESAASLARLVRAAAPEPGAQALFGDRAVEIVKARVCSNAPPPGLRPAEAWRSPDGWAVCCGDGALLLLEVRDAEGASLDLEGLFATRAGS